MPPLMTAVNTYGMPWRENFGILLTKMSSKMKNDPKYIKEMEQNLSEAEEILSKREINQVSDLNLGKNLKIRGLLQRHCLVCKQNHIL